MNFDYKSFFENKTTIELAHYLLSQRAIYNTTYDAFAVNLFATRVMQNKDFLSFASYIQQVGRFKDYQNLDYMLSILTKEVINHCWNELKQFLTCKNTSLRQRLVLTFQNLYEPEATDFQNIICRVYDKDWLVRQQVFCWLYNSSIKELAHVWQHVSLSEQLAKDFELLQPDIIQKITLQTIKESIVTENYTNQFVLFLIAHLKNQDSYQLYQLVCLTNNEDLHHFFLNELTEHEATELETIHNQLLQTRY